MFFTKTTLQKNQISFNLNKIYRKFLRSENGHFWGCKISTENPVCKKSRFILELPSLILEAQLRNCCYFWPGAIFWPGATWGRLWPLVKINAPGSKITPCPKRGYEKNPKVPKFFWAFFEYKTLFLASLQHLNTSHKKIADVFPLLRSKNDIYQGISVPWLFQKKTSFSVLKLEFD